MFHAMSLSQTETPDSELIPYSKRFSHKLLLSEITETQEETRHFQSIFSENSRDQLETFCDVAPALAPATCSLNFSFQPRPMEIDEHNGHPHYPMLLNVTHIDMTSRADDIRAGLIDTFLNLERVDKNLYL